MRSYRFIRLTTALLASCLSPLSFAAAFQFYELGAPINGLAGVGQAALTTDASIAYYNPAGMADLPSTALLLGSQAALPYTNFSPNDSTTISGSNGGNAGSFTPGLDAYYVYPVSPRFKLGASLTSPYGGSLSYDNYWVGRFNVQQMLLYTLTLNPALAYQLNDWVSVGAGFSIEYANLYQTVAIPLSPTEAGQATLKADSTAPGFNLGVLFAPTPRTHLGLAYRSQIVHHLSGNTTFLNISDSPTTHTKLVMPANIIASVSQQINPQFNLLGELGWSHWSSMTNTIVTIDGYSAVTPQNWHDTYRLGLGGQYLFNPVLLGQAGISYDSSPTSTSKRLPNLPMDRQIRVGVGLQYAIIKSAQLGLSYEYMNLGSAGINNTSANGTYAGSYWRNFANVFQASLNITI